MKGQLSLKVTSRLTGIKVQDTHLQASETHNREQEDYEEAGFASLTRLFSTEQLARITFMRIAAGISSLLLPLFGATLLRSKAQCSSSQLRNLSDHRLAGCSRLPR